MLSFRSCGRFHRDSSFASLDSMYMSRSSIICVISIGIIVASSKPGVASSSSVLEIKIRAELHCCRILSIDLVMFEDRSLSLRASIMRKAFGSLLQHVMRRSSSSRGFNCLGSTGEVLFRKRYISSIFSHNEGSTSHSCTMSDPRTFFGSRDFWLLNEQKK